jgi:hypothetical protein
VNVSSIPAVLDYLVAGISAHLPDVQVEDGQPIETEPDLICIGFTGTPGEVAVVNTLSQQGLARDPSREAYEITNLASAWDGGTDAKAVRDRCFALLGEVAAFLASDPMLGGLVMQARLSTQALAPEQTTKGATATVQFVIAIDAFANR